MAEDFRLLPLAEGYTLTLTVGPAGAAYIKDWHQRESNEGETIKAFLSRMLRAQALASRRASIIETARDEIQAIEQKNRDDFERVRKGTQDDFSREFKSIAEGDA